MQRASAKSYVGAAFTWLRRKLKAMLYESYHMAEAC